tara:strand:- start:801 stop:1031 length:231 start_codon:yes stop_codon:yes gene_type:complete
MNINFITMDGYGLYVWSSFIFTIVVCLYVFIRTRKTLKKLEKDFQVEVENLSEEKSRDFNKSKIRREILASKSETI